MQLAPICDHPHTCQLDLLSESPTSEQQDGDEVLPRRRTYVLSGVNLTNPTASTLELARAGAAASVCRTRPTPVLGWAVRDRLRQANASFPLTQHQASPGVDPPRTKQDDVRATHTYGRYRNGGRLGAEGGPATHCHHPHPAARSRPGILAAAALVGCHSSAARAARYSFGACIVGPQVSPCAVS
ncbi:uncharacterized protein B0I36DRAFT_330397 [Microdochium trichocladiopsis]|uniref:Uncharacterized protein n=1 Tax=Microdochium trichocladiopsis TaxID=1682393 RepID=A0A9P8Y1G9_9PEZI|nr:uncharacterized protein B0I36DRAFT_330397 [Microdochium trichocladiopsis]KAH7026326.1 hypothetical protein B0I36DRAFT_330397 [Microdochium trichocladiopsis]